MTLKDVSTTVVKIIGQTIFNFNFSEKIETFKNILQNKANSLIVNLYFFQLSIQPGKIQINFQIHDVNSDIKYFGIDDVTLTPGECPPLGMFNGINMNKCWVNFKMTAIKQMEKKGINFPDIDWILTI